MEKLAHDGKHIKAVDGCLRPVDAILLLRWNAGTWRMGARVCAVNVNRNGGYRFVRCLASLGKMMGDDVALCGFIVIDIASTDNSVVQAEAPAATVVPTAYSPFTNAKFGFAELSTGILLWPIGRVRCPVAGLQAVR